MDSINVKNLTKKFGDFTAVDAISFNVNEGEIFGLLGPNGAGKTTTINMLSTLISTSSGNAKVANFDVDKDKDKVRKNIGIVFQDPALDSNLTGKENLDFHGLIYGMKKQEREQKIKEVLKLVELEDKAEVLVEKYSGGMKRRLEIARGLIHNPKVLFLDEPTIGLDAQTRRKIWDYIKRLNKEEKLAIILTTHYMEEADFLCDRIAIIDHGKIVRLDTPENLKNLLGGDVISIKSERDSKKLVELFKNLKYVKNVKAHDGELSLTMETGEKRIPELVALAEKHKLKMDSISLHKPSLEDVFLHFTGSTIREEEASSTDIARESFRRHHGH
jgi:ABC-2 type transport system ATP-binding protein